MTDKTQDIMPVVIMTDQHRTNCNRLLGNPHAHTPVIDAMGGSHNYPLFHPARICAGARLATGKRPVHQSAGKRVEHRLPGLDLGAPWTYA